ncbi:MAG: 30S ribosomal protein S15 [Candidatus Pacebacteria bacterium]|nr:30S ribosomal protein S15 [Candidatus Paceibacterota bacterium]
MSKKDNKNNSGSSETQIISLTKQIENLSKHLKNNRKDLHSTRGLIKMISDRKKHIKYLKRTNLNTWNLLAKKLNLKN